MLENSYKKLCLLASYIAVFSLDYRMLTFLLFYRLDYRVHARAQLQGTEPACFLHCCIFSRL
jgi:hypothetical protein